MDCERDYIYYGFGIDTECLQQGNCRRHYALIVFVRVDQREGWEEVEIK